LELADARSDDKGYELRAIVTIKTLIDLANVFMNSALAPPDPLCNLSVRESVGQIACNLQLALGK
jgi:hypothetical protein